MCVCGDGRWLFVQAKHLRNWCQDRFLWVCLAKSCNHAYSIFLHHITPNDFAPHGVAGFSTSSSSNTRGSENSGVGLVFARLLQKWKRHEILMNFDESWQSQLNCQNWVAWRCTIAKLRFCQSDGLDWTWFANLRQTPWQRGPAPGWLKKTFSFLVLLSCVFFASPAFVGYHIVMFPLWGLCTTELYFSQLPLSYQRRSASSWSYYYFITIILYSILYYQVASSLSLKTRKDKLMPTLRLENHTLRIHGDSYLGIHAFYIRVHHANGMYPRPQVSPNLSQ